MGFGAHSAWIMSYILTSSGHLDSGWADIRRAIEFTCYATKVIDSKERALAWRQQKDDKEARALLSRTCSIPSGYVYQKG